MDAWFQLCRDAVSVLRIVEKDSILMTDGTFLAESFQNTRVTVMGLGRFGGGVAVTRFLVKQGAIVTLTDLTSEADLTDSLNALKPFEPARCVFGRHDERDFSEADFVVINPAVKPDNPYRKIAQAAGVSLTSEMNLFWQLHQGRIIAITGSNGKSTTAAVIHSILSHAGLPVRLGGNIGRSLLEEVEHIQPLDWTVLELSSFQLFDLNRIKARPEVAVITNFTPNHLDWHGCLEDYRDAKQSLLRWQTPADIAILNSDDPEVRNWPTQAMRLGFGNQDTGEGVFALPDSSTEWIARIQGIEQKIPLADWVRLPGAHNVQNAAAAVAASLAVGVNISHLKTGMETFTGLPHRLQFVIETQGRKFYNDSIATTPESVFRALASFSEPVILLAGGSDKGSDLSELANQIANRAKAVALLGKTGPKLEQHLRELKFPTEKMFRATSLTDAVKWAGGKSSKGDVILLSPGCASYDWFLNFADRGEQFIQLAKSWISTETD